jgi:hypothetical protein
MYTDVCGNSSGQKCLAKGSRKENKYESVCIEINKCGT